MKNTKWSGGRLKEISSEISRIFNGQPVIDAKSDLRIVILDDDIMKGKPKNFDECIFAQACKRVFNSNKVLLMRSIAYISLPDENGDYKVERYTISAGGRKVIADFDRGKMPKPGTSFVFNAPSKHSSLDAMRQAQIKHYKKKRLAKIKGEIKGEIKLNKDNTIKKGRVIKHIHPHSEPNLDVRNGTGLIQMRRQH